MLTELNIRNFAIIDELKVAFDGGLNVISGETGAGKSIIIGAVGLLLGDRANADMIRSFEDAAVVEALFDIRGQDGLREKIGEIGFGDGEELIVRRVVSRSGKEQGVHQRRSGFPGVARGDRRVADQYLRPARASDDPEPRKSHGYPRRVRRAAAAPVGVPGILRPVPLAQ